MFKPLHNYVLLERINEETTTAGGIIIPDNAREKPSRGRVIAAGPGLYDGDELIPMTVKTDDIVLFAKWEKKPPRFCERADFNPLILTVPAECFIMEQ